MVPALEHQHLQSQLAHASKHPAAADTSPALVEQDQTPGFGTNRFSHSRALTRSPACLASTLFAVAAEAQGADLLVKGDLLVKSAMPLVMNKLSTGKGDVNVDVQCTDVCSDVCTPVPQKVCNDVPYQTQVRRKRPLQCMLCASTTSALNRFRHQPPTTGSHSIGWSICWCWLSTS